MIFGMPLLELTQGEGIDVYGCIWVDDINPCCVQNQWFPFFVWCNCFLLGQTGDACICPSSASSLVTRWRATFRFWRARAECARRREESRCFTPVNGDIAYQVQPKHLRKILHVNKKVVRAKLRLIRVQRWNGINPLPSCSELFTYLSVLSGLVQPLLSMLRCIIFPFLFFR